MKFFFAVFRGSFFDNKKHWWMWLQYVYCRSQKKNKRKGKEKTQKKDCYNFLSLRIILRCSSGKFLKQRREILSEFDCSGTSDRSLNLSKTRPAKIIRKFLEFVKEEKFFRQDLPTPRLMEMASRYEQSLPIKLMTISNAEDVRRNSNRHPPVSATMSGPHSIYGGSNGKTL